MTTGLKRVISGFAMGVLTLSSPAMAQSSPNTACEPPAPNEYLLLVLQQTEQQPDRLRAVVPSDNSVVSCRYLDNDVIRIGGFKSVGIANSWAQYLIDVEGMQAFVTRPREDQPNASGTEAPAEGSSSATNSESHAEKLFAPQPLAGGYAVLVNYFNRPEVATDVGQVTGENVGLVAYEQQPFLLADYTTDPQQAGEILRQLSDRNFSAIIVDSRQAVLLTADVSQNLQP